MRNVLALIGALVIVFAVAGWYCGWYQVGVTKSADGNLRVETNVDTKKVATDAANAWKKVESAVGQQLDRNLPETPAAQVAPPAPVPNSAPETAPNGDTKVKIFGVDLTPKK